MDKINKKNNFVVLHYLGLLMVMAGHQFILLDRVAPSVINMEIHKLGVRLLFVVSGYLVMGSLLRTEDIGSFLNKRIRRIFPGLIICVLGEVLLLGPLFTELPIKTYFVNCSRFLIKNILLSPVFDLPGVFGNNPYANVVNGSLWTLPIEFACYIVIACQVYSVKKIFSDKNLRFVKGLLLIEFIVIYAIFALYEMGLLSVQLIVWGTDWASASVLIVYFISGCVIRIFHMERFDLRYAILMVVLYMAMPSVIQIASRPLLVSYLVMAFGLSPMTKLAEKLEQYDLYYAGYLWAFPVQQSIIYLLVVKNNICASPYVLFILSVICTMVIAWITTELIERNLFNKRWKI